MPAPVTIDPDRAKLMRAAGDLVGVAKLAERLGIHERSLHYFMRGERQAADGVVADTRRLLIEHRQNLGRLIQLFREHEGIAEGDAP